MTRSHWKPVVALAAAMVAGPVAAEPVPVSELSRHTHVHGLGVDRLDPDFLLIATHHGLYRAGPDGNADRISVVQDFMGFTAHPKEAGTLYASGHPAGGGNLGFIASSDNGASWKQVSPGLNGPVDFHQMTVSPADPEVVYGAYGMLQVSRDSGESWTVSGPLPEGLLDLAAAPDAADTLYAATRAGLLKSTDAGATWANVIEGAAVSLVESGPDGALYAFIVGRGLVRSGGGEQFDLLASDFGGVAIHIAIDPTDFQRMFVATHEGAILASTDGGATWQPY